MLQKHPSTDRRPFWTPEEIEKLRSSLQSNDIATVDTEMFGKRFSEIVLRGRNANVAGHRSK
jgi:hypothetical protein